MSHGDRITALPPGFRVVASSEGAPFALPDHLGAALDALDADEVVRGAMPGRLYDVFMHYKRDEWERYLAAVTDWEREQYLDVMP